FGAMIVVSTGVAVLSYTGNSAKLFAKLFWMTGPTLTRTFSHGSAVAASIGPISTVLRCCAGGGAVWETIATDSGVADEKRSTSVLYCPLWRNSWYTPFTTTTSPT